MPAAPAPADPAIPSPIRRRSRRVTLLLLSAVAGVLAALGLGLLWQQAQQIEELKRVVAAEDHAILAGDLPALNALTDPDDRLWFSLRPSSAGAYFMGWIAPQPHSFAWPVGQAGEVRALQRITPDLVQVEVVRRYATGESPSVPAETYVVPQFYRRRPDGWKRARPPASFWGEVQTRSGARLDWTYSAVDAAVVAELAPTLEQITDEACAAWACPDEARFAIWLDPEAGDTVGSTPFGQLSRLLGLRWPAERLSLPSPHAAGLPADVPARQAFERATAVRLLGHILSQIGPEYGGARRNPFWYALAARTAARLKVDLPEAGRSLVPEPALTAQALWATRLAFEGAGYDYDPVYQQALILLNRVLRDQPPEVEARLFQEFKTATDAAQWLAAGLALTVDEARARWAAAEAPLAVAVLADAPQAFALQCAADTLALWSPGGGQPAAVLPEWVPRPRPLAWSPDGQRLLIDVAYTQQAVVDFAAGQMVWLPDSGNWPRAQWLNATQLVYVVSPLINSARRSEPRLIYFDAAQPRHARPTIPGLGQYVRSPDGRWAAVSDTLYASPGSGSRLGLMPALGDTVRWLDVGAQPAWSPDSRALAYFSAASASPAALKIADLSGGEPRVVLLATDLQALAPDPAQPLNDVSAAWSPDGGRLVFRASSYGNRGPASWVGVINVDGSGLRLLWSDPMAATGQASFSPDGRYVALSVFSGNTSRTEILDLTLDRPLRAFSGLAPGWGGLGLAAIWGMDGRQLQLSDGVGLFQVGIDDLAEGDPQPVGLPCPVAVVNPQP